MKLVIFGANGPTGQLLTKQALAEGHTVTAVTRHPDRFPLQHEHLQVMGGDVFKLTSVEQAVSGQNAVLSTLGVPYSREPITVYSQGTEHIIQAMKEYGLRRLICVSSGATDPQTRARDTGGGFVFEKVLKPFLLNTGRTLYEDMEKMEKIVMSSGLDWTIIRPAGLFDTADITPYRTEEESIRGLFTSRADLADCMLRQVTTNQYLCKPVAIVTVSERPNMLRMIVKETFQSKPR